jgi:PAS domain S-box-containing protein
VARIELALFFTPWIPHALLGRLRDLALVAAAALSLAPALAAQGSAREFQQHWRWASFSTVDGLPSNRVTELVELDGTPYVATNRGLAWYDGWRWQSLGEESGLPAGPIARIGAGGDLVWVSNDSGLYVGTHEEGFDRVPLPSAFDASAIRATAHTPDGETLLIVDSPTDQFGQIFVLDGWRPGADPPAWKTANVPGYETLTGYPRMRQARSGRVWLKVDDSVFVWEDREWERRFQIEGADELFAKIAENASQHGLLAVLQPRQHCGLYEWVGDDEPTKIESEGTGIVQSLGVGPAGARVVLYDTYELRFSGAPGSGHEDWVSVLPLPKGFGGTTFMRFRDNGDLWVGGETGLSLLRRSTKRWARLFRRGFADPRNRVNELMFDRRGRLWVGNTGGIDVHGPDFQRLEIELPETTIVTGLGEDDEGVVWVSSGSAMLGLYGWTGDGWVRVTEDVTGAPLGTIHKIRKDQSGRLWLLALASDVLSRAETGGVHLLIDGAAVPWERGRALAGLRVYDVAETDDGALWFATSRGVHRLLGDDWTHWSTTGDERALPGPSVLRIQPHKDGGVWLSHFRTGLGRIDGSGVVSYVDLGNRASNAVWDFVPDGEHVWITSRRGLQCLHDDGSISTFDPTPGTRDPLAWPIIPTPERVFVGTAGGGTHILDRSDAEVNPPHVVIDSQRERDGTWRLTWHASSFWGEQLPENVQTRSRVNGGAWSPYSVTHERSLPELGPGSHDVDVQARGLFGKNGDIATTQIDVEVPFYAQLHFLIPVGILSLALTALLTAYVRQRRDDAAALRRSEAEYRTLMEQASDAILVLDTSGIVRNANANARALLGESTALVGRRADEFVDPADETGRVGLADAFRDPDPSVVSVQLRRPDGSIASVEASVKRLDDRVQAIIRDLTERHRLDDERRELERQVTESQKLESLGRLAGGLAHDFNNLLMLVLGHADNARHRIATDGQHGKDAVDSLDQVVQAAERAGELTQKLLAYSGDESMAPRPVDLNAFLGELRELLVASVSGQARLELDLAAELPSLDADPQRLGQVVMNLVVNSSDAIGDEGGEIIVSTRVVTQQELDGLGIRLENGDTEHGAVALEVADTGPGMTATVQRRIFEPFFTTRFQGRGLGLAAVRGIVRNHGGSIRVESAPGRGATFTVFLPRSARAVPDRGATANKTNEATAERILVVDDDAGVRRIVATMLERSGYDVLLASSGNEGVDLYRRHLGGITCALIDLTMPGMDGRATHHAIIELDPNAVVLLMSGFNEEAVSTPDSPELSESQEIRAGFIQKPFKPDALVAEIQILVRGATIRPPSPAPRASAEASS